MAATQAPIGVLHFVEEQVYKAQKALIAAKFNGLVLTAQKFDVAKAGKTPSFVAMNPVGKVPFLETDMGCIASSNAVARYVARCRADTSLYGKSFDDEGQIDTWMEFSTYELEIPLAVWLYPVLGLMEQPPAVATENAKGDVKKSLQVLEDRLKASKFLVGDFATLADIVVVCVLREAFARLFDPAFRKPFGKVSAWLELCCAMPQFKAVLGTTKLCTQAEKPQPVKVGFAALAAAPKKDAHRKDGKKEEPKKASPKASPKAAPAAASSPKAKPAASPKAAAAAAPAAAGGSDAEVKAVGDQIRVLKETLKGEGLSGKKINDHEEIKVLVAKLQTLKEGEAAPAAAPTKPASPKSSPKASPKSSPKAAPAAAGGDVEAQVKKLGDDIRILKEKLKGEGISGKKLNDHPEIKEMVSKLGGLKKQMA